MSSTEVKDKVKVVMVSGTIISLLEWQLFYGLERQSLKIGKHFSLEEDRFKTDLVLYGELVVNAQLIKVLDAFREAINLPITLNSFNRTQEHQNELTEKGYKTAKYSP